MDSAKVVEILNKNRHKTEACFVFSLWNEPELYEDYRRVNEGKDRTLKDKDARFYFLLGRQMYKHGFRTFDHITVDTFVEGQKAEIRQKYEAYGGYKEISEIMSIVSPDNVDGYFDEIAKLNMLGDLCVKYEEAFEDPKKFENMSSEEVYNYFEYLNSDTSLATGNKEQIEDLVVDDEFIQKLESGENQGFSYYKFCPSLNYLTLGAKPGSLYLIGGFSGTGKSSWVFECMLMGMHYEGIKTAIISNEMMIDTYQVLLLEHVLVNDLNYWKLNRKQIKVGKYNEEQKHMLGLAQKIVNEKYSDVYFVKLFDNNIEKIMKYMRKLKAMGVSVVLYDTFKSDDSAGVDNIWQSLMLDARKLFQCVSRLGMCCVTTYQLALHAENTRYLTASCLSNSKQIKEIYETMVYMRPLWDDERDKTSRNYVHPYRYSRDNGKIKEEIELNKDDKYMLFFVDKNRADEDKQVLIYKWQAAWNKWTELGYAKVMNDHGIGRT